MDYKYNRGNYDKYTSKNILKRKMVDNLNKKILDEIQKIAKENTNRKIKLLDVGCGEGFITNLIYDNIDNVEICGIEYTKEAVDIAKKLNSNIKFEQGNIYDIHYESNTFDIVLCTEVLEHLEHPDRALVELKRVSKKHIILSVPHEPWFCLGNLLVLKNVSRLGNPIDHINHWTHTKFNKFIEMNLGKEFQSKLSFPWIIIKYSKC